MIGLLGEILAGIGLFGEEVLWGIMTAVNLLLAGFGLAVEGVFSVLPSMTNAPALGAPAWLKWVNWFFPLGDLLAAFATALTLFTAFMLVRYLLRLLRAV